MPIGEISGVGGGSAALGGIRRSAAGGFAEMLRAQIRDELARALAGERPASASNSAGSTARAGATASPRVPGAGWRSPTRDAATESNPWFGYARSIGGQYLSPELAEVFARQMALESAGFDPEVIAGRRLSGAGAEGIAQLMPSSYPNVNRRDPVASLHAAAGTMRADLQQYGGDPRKALAAYNAGGDRVAAEIARLGPAWESGLPSETQRYLRELLGPAGG